MNKINYIFSCLILFACCSYYLQSSEINIFAVEFLNHRRAMKQKLGVPVIDRTMASNYPLGNLRTNSNFSTPTPQKELEYPHTFSNFSRSSTSAKALTAKQELDVVKEVTKPLNPHSNDPTAKKRTESCNISFLFRVMGLDCRATKTIKLIPNSSRASGCPYVHPYLEFCVNKHLEATFIADVESVPEKYSFEQISIPRNITAHNIMVRIGSYFKSNFDILANLDVQRDINAEVREVNTVLLDWTQVLPWPPSQHNTHAEGALSCEPSHAIATDPSVVNKSAAQCSFSQFTPGFWDKSKHVFLPADCAFRPRPLLDRAREPGVWVHFLGDSNMRYLHTNACNRIRGLLVKREGHIFCISRDWRRALVYTVSWMNENGTGPSRLGALPQLIGQPLAPILCTMRRSPACKADWNRTAALTLALVGSHYPQQLIPPARADVHAWLAGIAARLPPGLSALAVVLIGAVCVGGFHRVPRYWAQLFQRNNYRVRAVNNATLEAARSLGLPALDAFSVTLAAGCEGESLDVVHFTPAVYLAELDAYFRLP